MVKRIFCMLLVVVMLLTCAACSNKNDSNPHKPNNSSEIEAENTANNQHTFEEQDGDETDDPANEGGWYLEDKEINGWKFQVIHDPDWEFEYDVPAAEYQDTTVTIAGETKTVTCCNPHSTTDTMNCSRN